MPLIAKILPMPGPHTVAATVVPGSHPFELAVACEVFGLDRPELGEPLYRFVVCGVGPRVDLGPFTLETEHGIDALARADTVIVPASNPDLVPPPEFLAALRDAYARGARLVSFCSGAFALAAAGVLDGRRVTTHWMYAVRHDHGAEIANYIARRMVVPPHRDGGQAQFLIQPMPDSSEADTLGPTLDWIVDNLDRPLTIEEMAAHALMSTRTFMRRFRAATGTTPLRWLSQQRVEHARRVLESTDVPVDRVAQVSGFGSAANFRVHFQRTVGTAPTSYRRAFRI